MAFQDNILRFLQGMNTFGIPQQGPIMMDDPRQGGISGTLPRTGMNMQEEPPFTPKTDAQERLRVALDQMPTRNTPGVWRKIGASIAGLGGPQAADDFMYGGYYRKMDDWKNQIEPLGDLARIENQENTQNRMIWNTNQTGQRAQDRLDFQREQEERRRAKDEGDLEIKRKRLELDTELANGGKAIADRNGNLILITKKGEVKDLDRDMLSFKDKLELETAGRLTVVDDQQAAARELARIRAAYDAENIRLRGEVSKDVNAAKASSPDQMTPNEIKQEKINRVAEYVRAHPELEGRITEDDLGNIRMTPKRVYPWQSPDPNDAKVIQEFNDWVDKGVRPKRMGAVPAPTTEKSSTGVTPERAAQVAPDNMIRVRNKKTGQTGRMKRSELGKYKDFEEIK